MTRKTRFASIAVVLFFGLGVGLIFNAKSSNPSVPSTVPDTDDSDYPAETIPSTEPTGATLGPVDLVATPKISRSGSAISLSVRAHNSSEISSGTVSFDIAINRGVFVLPLPNGCNQIDRHSVVCESTTYTPAQSSTQPFLLRIKSSQPTAVTVTAYNSSPGPLSDSNDANNTTKLKV